MWDHPRPWPKYSTDDIYILNLYFTKCERKQSSLTVNSVCTVFRPADCRPVLKQDAQLPQK